jgi:hypothetical protein
MGCAKWRFATVQPRRRHAEDARPGNRYLSRRFGTDPCFRLDSNGFSIKTC